MIPKLHRVDHIHIHVSDRAAAEVWYREVLGFSRLSELEFWAAEGGPLTLANDDDTIHLALFERPFGDNRSRVAMGTDGDGFLAWQRHLSDALGGPVEAVDHDVSWSMYFDDPDGNPYEITSYDYEQIALSGVR